MTGGASSQKPIPRQETTAMAKVSGGGRLDEFICDEINNRCRNVHVCSQNSLERFTHSSLLSSEMCHRARSTSTTPSLPNHDFSSPRVQIWLLSSRNPAMQMNRWKFKLKISHTHLKKKRQSETFSEGLKTATGNIISPPDVK